MMEAAGTKMERKKRPKRKSENLAIAQKRLNALASYAVPDAVGEVIEDTEAQEVDSRREEALSVYAFRVRTPENPPRPYMPKSPKTGPKGPESYVPYPRKLAF